MGHSGRELLLVPVHGPACMGGLHRVDINDAQLLLAGPIGTNCPVSHRRFCYLTVKEYY
jgi:hypothetical protein